jgi:hypothetical protein
LSNEIFRNELKKEIRGALKAYEDASALDHSGLRGRVREIAAAKLIKPILPPGIEIGTGKITDSTGSLSAETDLVVYSRLTLPPLIYGQSTGLFPVESCVYAIEVKSQLTATELQSSIEKFRRVRALRYLESFYPLNFLNPIGPACSFVIPVLFAFSTDLSESGKTEIERYREHDDVADQSPIIPVLCVPGRGYWWFKPSEPDKKWIHHPPTGEHDEVIDFIGGLANTIPVEVIKKGQPYYGNYIIKPRPFNKE